MAQGGVSGEGMGLLLVLGQTGRKGPQLQPLVISPSLK